MNKITGKTSLYCIIGMPAHHSLSPVIHNAMYEKLHMDSVFMAFDVSEGNLENAILGMQAYKIRAMTLTSPHKQNAMKYVDVIDKKAKELGAVNAIVPKNGKLYGYNTDEPGSVMSLKKHGIDKKAVYTIFGAGGAARAIAFGLAHEGIRNFNIINRSIANAEKLGKSLAKDFHGMKIKTYRLSSKDSFPAIKESKYVINATNITLENKVKTPVPSELLNKSMIVFDANYAPLDNRLLTDARKKGCVTITGLDLLVYNQAVAFKLFTGREPDYKTMMDAALHASGQKAHAVKTNK